MRAVLCESLDGPDALTIGVRPDPVAGPGEVLVDIKAGGLNFADTLMVQGKYQEKPPLPFVPGLEAAGVVAAVGEGVIRVKPGDRVAALVDYGAFAEKAVARERDVFPIPDSMDFEAGAAFPVAYGTAHGGLVWRDNLQPGEVLVVHGAAGGAGLAAVEVGKAMGATVIATAGGPEKVALALARGADHGIDYKTEDVKERVRALTGGEGADVYFDPVGGDVFDASIRAIRFGGRIVVIGFAAGRIPQVPANLLLVKNIAVTGLYWGEHRRRHPDWMLAQFADLTRWHAEGRLNPHISHRFPLEQAGEAMRTLLARKSTGKVVLTV
ncbi:NADPH:quinone oxidoreductase family protein [Oceanibaculum pacificum]|uniref:Enoyl reductase (ER) domain-containing protein n=1 Tax=Oceanibaculum pacificum TaxID=580166 RepID=A0A154WFL6_9PROT|nr:NADPH:quinone oxidoreductase family protein [Oceanibaculum pacificum]KZD12318.1 hypothetical protein AUP43_04920 [Oceanibaculum pacificum]